MNKVSLLVSKGVILAFVLGIVTGGALSAIISIVDSYLRPNGSDWIKYSHGWYINILVTYAVIFGVAGAILTAFFATIVALFNIGYRRSLFLRIAWILETVIWVVIGILEFIILQRHRRDLIKTEFLTDWLFIIILLGILAGFIGLICATNKKDKGKEPLLHNPLHGLAVGLVLVPALIAMIWTTIMAFVGW